MKLTNFFRFLAITCAALAFTSCSEDDDQQNPNNNLPDIEFYALDRGISLDHYNTSSPGNLLNSTPITGLQQDETILSIDFRPATGQLYGIGSSNRLYVIDPDSGVARQIGSGPISPTVDGNIVGFDFNPTVDRIRLVTSNGQNLRLNPETGTVVATDGSINGVTGAVISGSAYTSNMAGASSTTLYNIDSNNRKLYKQDPPNNGTLVEIADINAPISGEGGFDIAPSNDIALALYEAGDASTLYTIDLMTGNSTLIQSYPQSKMYTGIAIVTNPVAYSVNQANQLMIFNPAALTMNATKNITGIGSGETLWGIDFRPVNGQLYGLGSSGQLYTINTSSGAATAVGAPISSALTGSDYGFDFNPLVDRIRIVSNSGENLRVNPTDGTTTVDGNLNPGIPKVSAAAYTNNFAGTTTTSLFVIDAETDKLYIQNPPNAGTLTEIGALGIDVMQMSGFDIGGRSNMAYAVLTTTSGTMLYQVNTSTGMVMAVGSLPGAVTGMAVGLGF